MNDLARVLVVFSVFALLPGAAIAHGGIYRGPTAPGPGGGPSSPGGGPARGGVATLSGTPSWRYWWALNWDRVVDARVRLATGAASKKNRQAGDPSWLDFKPLSKSEKRKLLLPPLLEGMKDKDGEVRAAAAIALGKLALPEVVAPLVKGLKDPERLVRKAVGLALGLSGQAEVEEALIKAFNGVGTANEERAWLAVGLGYLGTKKTVRLLLDQLASLTGKAVPRSNREVLICCAGGLTVCKDPSVAPDIMDLLKKAGNRIVEAQSLLLLALGKLGNRVALPLIREKIQDKNGVVRAGAAAGAGQLGRPEDQELLRVMMDAAATDAHYTIRAITMVALGRIGGSRVISFLRTQPGSGRVKLTFLEAFASTGLALAESHPSSAGLDSRVVDRRGATAICLAIANTRKVGNRLVAMLKKEKNPTLFSELSLAVGMLQAPGGIEYLRRVMKKERKSAFRTSAAVSLGFLGDGQVLDEVLKLLAEAPSANQQAPLVFAATLFGQRKAVAGITALFRRRKAQDTVRALCCVALGNIGDSRRYPVLSALSQDFPWVVSTPALSEMVMLY